MAFVTLYKLFIAGGWDDTDTYLSNAFMIEALSQTIATVNFCRI